MVRTRFVSWNLWMWTIFCGFLLCLMKTSHFWVKWGGGILQTCFAGICTCVYFFFDSFYQRRIDLKKPAGMHRISEMDLWTMVNTVELGTCANRLSVWVVCWLLELMEESSGFLFWFRSHFKKLCVVYRSPFLNKPNVCVQRAWIETPRGWLRRDPCLPHINNIGQFCMFLSNLSPKKPEDTFLSFLTPDLKLLMLIVRKNRNSRTYDTEQQRLHSRMWRQHSINGNRARA